VADGCCARQRHAELNIITIWTELASERVIITITSQDDLIQSTAKSVNHRGHRGHGETTGTESEFP
jgi:hypothetical protein